MSLKEDFTHCIRSMTGFGRSQRLIDRYLVTIEIRSVNHRYRELNIHLPKEFSQLEDPFRQVIAQRLKRGRIDLTLTVEVDPNHVTGNLNWKVARQIFEAARALKEKFQLEDPIRLDHFLMNPEVWNHFPPPSEGILQEMIEVLHEALDKVDEMRIKEGRAVREELVARMERIERLRGEIEAFSPNVALQYQMRLRAKMKELLNGTIPLDEGRLLMEAAYFADRSDISEELSRLKSHEEQFLSSLTSENGVGRKLDFILQEMNREVNTIGSKANDALIAQRVVDLKSEIEKIREQVQNIE